jgi:hypothetical protein
MPSPARVAEVVRLASGHVAVARVDRAAHAVNFSHPEELATVVEAWLDGTLLAGGAHLPAGVRVVHLPGASA